MLFLRARDSLQNEYKSAASSADIDWLVGCIQDEDRGLQRCVAARAGVVSVRERVAFTQGFLFARFGRMHCGAPSAIVLVLKPLSVPYCVVVANVPPKL